MGGTSHTCSIRNTSHTSHTSQPSRTSHAALRSLRHVAAIGAVTSQSHKQPHHPRNQHSPLRTAHLAPVLPKWFCIWVLSRAACSCAPRAQGAGTYGDRDKEKIQGIHDARLALDFMNLSICLSLFTHLRAWGRRWVE